MSQLAVAAVRPRGRWHDRWLMPAAGAIMASALPPLGFLPAVLAPGALFLALLRQPGYWAGFRIAWLFGLGFHMVGLYWVGIAFFADAERFGALAVPGVVALAAVLACLGAAPLGLLAARNWSSPLAAALVFAGLWCVGEVVRGSYGVQFPWNPLALSLVATDVSMQVVALVGTTGASFLLAWLAGLAGVAWGFQRGRRTAALLASLIVFAIAGFGYWRLGAQLPLAAGDDTLVRVVQGNIAQHHKWDPALRQRWFERHLTLSMEPRERHPDVIVWPESSVPYSLEAVPEVRNSIGRVVDAGGHVILGANFYDPSVEPPRLHNSIYAVAAGGTILARYDKVDLVPFGEFLPFRPLFGRLGLEALAVGSMDFAPGAGRSTISLDGLAPFSPLICYEAAFPGRATDGTGRARWIANVTNDAWFGISSGPHQHAGMARMRAVEAGLPLVRAANTGISLITDARGRIQAELPLGITGILDWKLPQALAVAPPATRLPWLAATAIAILLGIAGIIERCGRDPALPPANR